MTDNVAYKPGPRSSTWIAFHTSIIREGWQRRRKPRSARCRSRVLHKTCVCVQLYIDTVSQTKKRQHFISGDSFVRCHLISPIVTELWCRKTVCSISLNPIQYYSMFLVRHIWHRVARFFWRQAANIPRKVAQICPNICACIKWKNRHRVCHTAYMIFRMCCFFVVVVNLFNYVSNIVTEKTFP